VDRTFADLYSDADALASIETALPALNSSNPREIKRYINLFRFYTFIVQRQRLDGLAAPPGDCIAKLAALAIRWPHLLTSLSQPSSSPDRVPGALVTVLEQAARTSTDSVQDGTDSPEPPADPWCAALRATGLSQPEEGGAEIEPNGHRTCAASSPPDLESATLPPVCSDQRYSSRTFGMSVDNRSDRPDRWLGIKAILPSHPQAPRQHSQST